MLISRVILQSVRGMFVGWLFCKSSKIFGWRPGGEMKEGEYVKRAE